MKLILQFDYDRINNLIRYWNPLLNVIIRITMIAFINNKWMELKPMQLWRGKGKENGHRRNPYLVIKYESPKTRDDLWK